MRAGEKPWDFRWVFISVDGATTSPYNCQVIYKVLTHTHFTMSHTHTHIFHLSLFHLECTHAFFLTHSLTHSHACVFLYWFYLLHIKKKKTETGTDQMEKRVENVFFVGWKFCVFFCNALHSFSQCELCQLRFAVLFCKCIIFLNK